MRNPMLPPAVTDLNCQLVTVPFTGEVNPAGAVSEGTARFMVVHATLHPGLISSAGPVRLVPIVTAALAEGANDETARAVSASTIEPLLIIVAIVNASG